MPRIVTEYPDGTRVECSLAEWLEANGHDEECLDALRLMRSDPPRIVTMGGGAAPLCRLHVED